uniref:Uncharacterized protein n=1 Tax=mine drainage metagenome TaxID=410659 RepID=E6Q040_9ZZZZ
MEIGFYGSKTGFAALKFYFFHIQRGLYVMALLLRWLFGIIIDRNIRKAIFSYPTMNETTLGWYRVGLIAMCHS